MAPDYIPIHYCWICRQEVALETCKTDEHGSAVHETCYVARMKTETPALQRSIVKFLQSASVERVQRCPCGAIMEQVDAIFSYEGQGWKIQLPVCPKCARPKPVHES